MHAIPAALVGRLVFKTMKLSSARLRRRFRCGASKAICRADHARTDGFDKPRPQSYLSNRELRIEFLRFFLRRSQAIRVSTLKAKRCSVPEVRVSGQPPKFQARVPQAEVGCLIKDHAKEESSTVIRFDLRDHA
jgi:hypothetical protein